MASGVTPVRPTGTKYVRSYISLILTDVIHKRIFDIVHQVQGTSLKAKGARSVMKLGIGMSAGHSMRFIRRMILARLLAPSEIGVMAIVLSISMAFEAFTEVGVKQAIIQNKRGADADYLNVAWWFQVARGLILFIVAYLAAPWISSFYHMPELLRLLQVAFFAILFRGLVSPRAFVLEKEYKFGRAVFLTQGSVLLGSTITIVLAFLIRNVWALVVGFVAEMVIRCLLSFILVPFLPRLKIDRKSLSELTKFARGMFGLPILAVINFQAHILVLGRVIPDAQLGLYSYAALLAYLPIDLYGKIINPVLLPGFSEKQDDRNALCRGVLQITRWTAIICIPLIAFIASCASELLALVYSAPYAAMAIPFAVLSLWMLFQNQSMVLLSAYLALGKPHLHRWFAIVRAAVILSLIYPASVYFGPLGAAFVIVLSNCIIVFLQVIGCRRIIDLRIGAYIRSYFPGLLMALPILAVVGLLWISGIDVPMLRLGVGVVVFLAMIGAGGLILSRPG